jgi:hypothetical protein
VPVAFGLLSPVCVPEGFRSFASAAAREILCRTVAMVSDLVVGREMGRGWDCSQGRWGTRLCCWNSGTLARPRGMPIPPLSCVSSLPPFPLRGF